MRRKPTFLMDLNGRRVASVNREFTQLFGYTAQELQGRLLSELIVPDEFHREFQSYVERVSQRQRVGGGGGSQTQGWQPDARARGRRANTSRGTNYFYRQRSPG